MGRQALHLIALAALGCTPYPAEPETPDPIIGAECEEAGANMDRLGCPGPETMSWTDACVRQNSNVDDFGEPIRAMNTECLAGAKSCDEAEQCR